MKLWTKHQQLVNTNNWWLENIHFLKGHHSPADQARELFKSGLNGERLVV